jgi:hypothetical protein
MRCTRNSFDWGMGDPCPACGHHALVHPGAGGTTSCTVCDLLALDDDRRARMKPDSGV